MHRPRTLRIVPAARIAAAIGLLGCTALAVTAQADSADGRAVASEPPAWNDPHVLRVIERARALRQSVVVDSSLRSYQAEARGYVYFFVDRPDSTTNVLVKADQVALDLHWRAPRATNQTIVGLRDEKLLPTSVRYHLDHLTVVQDDFGDFIRLGDGDEVEEVVHPISPVSSGFYDFQLADSLTISYAGGTEEIRVYEVRVRPRDFDRPGYVGTVFLDRDRAAIVRMNFSFTPASYVDPYLDYIRISLDNSLWLGEFWLPYRQEVEIRREIPVFDFLSGSIIRSTFDIRGYDFNVELPATLFLGRPVTSVSPAQQRAFPFERGLFDDLEESGGLVRSQTMEEVEAQVQEVVEDEIMSGLAPLRLHLGALSDFARYNRAEGIFAGAGVTLRPTPGSQVRTVAGYSFGRDRVSAATTVSASGGGSGSRLEAYWDALGDIGGHPGATPLENTMTSASGSKDYLDPFFRRGLSLTLRPGGSGRWSVGLTGEEHVGARDVVSDGPETDFRPVRSIDEGTLLSASLGWRPGLPGNGDGGVLLRAGRLAGRDLISLDADASWSLAGVEDDWSALLSATGGITNAGAPAQALYLIGGRHTLPGHAYRSFAGNAYWLVRAEGTVPIYPPYVGIRAFLTAGETYLGSAQPPPDWAVRDSRGVRGTVGLGLSFGWDAMRFDVGRAVRGTGWEALFSVAPQFRSWM